MHTTMAWEFYEKEWKTFLKCKECGEFKELIIDNWYPHNQWFMWFLWRCKDCIRKWRKTERERVMSRKRDTDRYHNNPERRAYIFESSTRRRKIKWYSSIHLKTDRHIKKLWCRPYICPFCWKFHERIIAHHPDYSKRYEVVFCCPSCHSKIHNWDIEINESMIKNIL